MKMVVTYFYERMRKIFVERVEYKVVETFERYLAHRYGNSCYWYSEYALIGLNYDDILVRGDITVEEDCIWCDGGYNHGWVEFFYNGKTYVFDSRLTDILLKEEWYTRFKPQNMIKRTKKQILNFILTPENCLQKEEYCLIRPDIGEEDKDYLVKPLRNAKFHIVNGEIERAIMYRETFGRN